MSAGGAMVTNLFASTSTSFTGSWKVNVFDNGSSVFACQITNSTGTSSAPATCSNTGSVTVSAGHYLQVKVTQASGTPANATWRVSFRY